MAELTAKEKRQQEEETRIARKLEEKDSRRSEVLKKDAEKQAGFEHLDKQKRLMEEAVRLLLDGEKSDRARIESLQSERIQMAQKETDLDQTDRAIQASESQLESNLRSVEVSLERMRESRETIEAEMKASEAKAADLNDSEKRFQNELHHLEMKIMDLGYQEKSIFERMDQAYHVKLGEFSAENYPWEERDRLKTEEEISELREKVEAMGTVNLLAIEEYEEMKQRYDFMTAQKKDMESAKEELLEAIRKINRTTKTLFEETFTNVQNAFKDYYQTLFRGGEARLVLVDESQPLESGIDIVVRPPGKKLQHISLLSGGEKALTAIALLFALFKIKPSPFCVLDEVDAPLDEANIDRFLAVLRTFLTLSQFIIITHNRKTIAMGDSLYGVTMEEAGVSKIVSVKVNIDDRDKTPEPAVDTKSEPVNNPVVA